MASSSPARVSTEQHAALEALVADLRGIFGRRLLSLVLYGFPPSPAANDGMLRTLGLLERYTFDDLRQCVPLAYGWHRQRLAVPLLLTHNEFFRTLDVFPLEYGNIIASHLVIYGDSPFEGARVRDADRRRGCEHQAKSHLIHLREGYLESGGDARDVADLIAASAPAFRALLLSLARLETTDAADPSDQELAGIVEQTIGISATVVAEVLSFPVAASTVADPTALLQRYVEASEKIWNFVDRAES